MRVKTRPKMVILGNFRQHRSKWRGGHAVLCRQGVRSVFGKLEANYYEARLYRVKPRGPSFAIKVRCIKSKVIPYLKHEATIDYSLIAWSRAGKRSRGNSFYSWALSNKLYELFGEEVRGHRSVIAYVKLKAFKNDHVKSD